VTTLERRHPRGLGKPVSAVGAGCWTIGGPTTNRGVPVGWDGVDPGRALDGLLRSHELGVTLYDTADVYGHGRSEQLLGKLLAQVRRDELVISSKVGYVAGPAAHPYQPQQMRRQLHRTLANLGIDHLDLYCFHSSDFGPDDRFLPAAVEQMRSFVEQGVVHAIGMRAPHEFATEWANRTGTDNRGGQAARFLHLFNTIRPDVVIARYNLLSPLYAAGETDIFELARQTGTGVIIKQAFGQGLLLGSHDPDRPRTFGQGDHRRCDPTFTPEAVRAVHEGLGPLRDRFGGTVAALTRVALRYALARDPDAPALVGFRDDTQISTSVTALGTPLTADEITWLHQSLAPLRHSFTLRAGKQPAPRPTALSCREQHADSSGGDT
jgi:aryl-alcohol dehydrogenase-like predicted oxidoreductase